MMKVSGPSGAAPASGARKNARASGEFRIDGAPRAAGAAAAGPLTPAETLSALIALQGADGRARGRARTLAAARRALDLLDRLRLGLLEGAVSAGDLDSLAIAAERNRDSDSPDEDLSALCEEIRLRARVELAKRGR